MYTVWPLHCMYATTGHLKVFFFIVQLIIDKDKKNISWRYSIQKAFPLFCKWTLAVFCNSFHAGLCVRFLAKIPDWKINQKQNIAKVVFKITNLQPLIVHKAKYSILFIHKLYKTQIIVLLNKHSLCYTTMTAKQLWKAKWWKIKVFEN